MDFCTLNNKNYYFEIDFTNEDRSITALLYLIFLTFSDLAVLYTGLLRQWVIYLFEV